MQKEVLVLLILIILSGCSIYVRPDIPDPEEEPMTGTQCSQMGGRIVDTFGGESCNSNEKNMGDIEGMECPCICCVEK